MLMVTIYSCDKCGKSFSSSFEINTIRVYHDNYKVELCEECLQRIGLVIKAWVGY
jgi:hypothetical protein